MNDAPSTYRHTQIGWALLAVLFAGAGLVAFAASRTGWSPAAWSVFAFLGIVAALFCTLTVEVAGGDVLLRFGPGLIHRRIARAEIARVEAVRNPWHFGWGIRFTPYGWLFSVSGLDAVEVGLISGKAVRIGTDEPAQLAAAIRASSGFKL
jgi:hypothetical protein